MWHKMLMTNLCFEQIASLIINDKTKVRRKILLSPVQDSNRLLYTNYYDGDFEEYIFHRYITKIIYEIESLKV